MAYSRLVTVLLLCWSRTPLLCRWILGLCFSVLDSTKGPQLPKYCDWKRHDETKDPHAAD